MLVLPWTIVTEFTTALASTFTAECYRKVLSGNLLEKLGFVPSTQNVDFVNLEKNVSSKRHLRIIAMGGEGGGGIYSNRIQELLHDAEDTRETPGGIDDIQLS